MKDYFCVNVQKYDASKCFDVVRPASLNNPKDNSVMFIAKEYMEQADVFNDVKDCLIFWPSDVAVPENLSSKHAVFACERPHTEYCRFFRDNAIVSLPQKEEYDFCDGSYIAKNAKIGTDVTIMPGVLISGDSVIGDNVYIGTGTKIIGEVEIGNNVVIRENCIIGSDSLTTDRDKDGSAITMPQFGKVIIDDNVYIGTGTIINRAAIDTTNIRKGAKISGGCYISHNVDIGENAFIVGETMILGSAVIGKNCLISGNCTVNVKVRIGENTTIGMGSVVTKNIPESVVAFGIPAKVMKNK